MWGFGLLACTLEFGIHRHFGVNSREQYVVVQGESGKLAGETLQRAIIQHFDTIFFVSLIRLLERIKTSP